MKNLTVEIGLVVANAIFQIVGVLFWGWPLGNLFLLFWFENLLLTLIAVVRMVIYRKLPGGSGKNVLVSSISMLMFCLVHFIFSGLLAMGLGYEITLFALILPAVLLIIRYLIELANPAKQKPTNFSQTYNFAIARIVALHLLIILSMFIILGLNLTPQNQIPIQLAVLVVFKSIAELVPMIRMRAPTFFSPLPLGEGQGEGANRRFALTRKQDSTLQSLGD